MATARRMETADLVLPHPEAASNERSPLERAISEDPSSFEFFQAVRVLERLFPDRQRVGELGDPGEEVVRFAADTAIAFPASEIQSLEVDRERPDEPFRMTVNFMGLTGPQGVLPLWYSLQVADRARARDYALRDFLGMFDHRVISLFYKAWERSRFAIAHERDQRDSVTRHLLDLMGLGTEGLSTRLSVRDETLLFYSGLLGLQSRPAAALQQLLTDYFGVPVEIEQFVGGWYDLEPASQCHIGDDSSPSAQLGWGSVVGDAVWDQQSRVRIRLGPMTRPKYEEFLPTGSAYAPLRSLTRFFSSDQYDFDVQLVMVRDDVPSFALGLDDASTPPLGWCTWLRSTPFVRDPDDTILPLDDTRAPVWP